MPSGLADIASIIVMFIETSPISVGFTLTGASNVTCNGHFTALVTISFVTVVVVIKIPPLRVHFFLMQTSTLRAAKPSILPFAMHSHHISLWICVCRLWMVSLFAKIAREPISRFAWEQASNQQSPRVVPRKFWTKQELRHSFDVSTMMFSQRLRRGLLSEDLFRQHSNKPAVLVEIVP